MSLGINWFPELIYNGRYITIKMQNMCFFLQEGEVDKWLIRIHHASGNIDYVGIFFCYLSAMTTVMHCLARGSVVKL